MSMSKALVDWCNKKLEGLSMNDPTSIAKAFGYGMIRGIPDGLMLVGLMVYTKATVNLIRGKGWRI